MADSKPPLVDYCDHTDDILSPAETAKQLGLSRSQLAKWRIAGKGPVFVKFGRKVGYTRWGNAAFIRANLQHRPDPV